MFSKSNSMHGLYQSLKSKLIMTMTKCWLQDEYITSNQNCVVGYMLHGWWTWKDEEHDYKGMEQNNNHEKI